MSLPQLPSMIDIRDVGPRDGLQAEAPVTVENRIRLVEALVVAGLRAIEVCSFVSPKAVPAMAGAAEVVAGIGRPLGVEPWALVPNVRGAQMARESGLEALSVTVSASATYSMKNTNMTIVEAMASMESIVEATDGEGVVDVVISCAFGSPYEGEIAPSVVAQMADHCWNVGAASVTLADTTGMATPRRIDEVVSALSGQVRDYLGLHLHETRGTGLTNAYAAMQLGVRRFDTSVGGLGGSPFADGAAGNLATEDLVLLCEDLGVATGVDLDRLLEASALVSSIIGRPVPSRVAAAGPRLRLAGV